MCPLPIRKNSEEIPMVNEKTKDPIVAQEFFNLFPFIEHLFGGSKKDEDEKNNIKQLWLQSSSLGDNTIQVGKTVDAKIVENLKQKGFVSGNGDRYRLTEKGSKLLRDAILNDEKSSLTKKASKKMVSKNSYDFGEYVFVKVQSPEKFGMKYVNISKPVFARKKIEPIKISEYKISTRKNDGSIKNISEYSEQELIHILHLAKKIIDNSHNIILAGSQITSVPVHQIKEFSIKILEELNKRK